MVHDVDNAKNDNVVELFFEFAYEVQITGIEAEPILLGITNYQINGFFEAKFVS